MASRKTAGSGTRGRRSTSGEPPSGSSELILYTTPDQQTRIEVRLEDETVWLSQVQMAELFQTTKQNVSLHIRNVLPVMKTRATGPPCLRRLRTFRD